MLKIFLFVCVFSIFFAQLIHRAPHIPNVIFFVFFFAFIFYLHFQKNVRLFFTPLFHYYLRWTYTLLREFEE